MAIRIKEYFNFHKHTHESNVATLDCIVKPIDYINRTIELGQHLYCSCEHGWSGKYLENFDLCKANNLKLIYGSELYIVKDRLEKDNSNNHIVVIGKNMDAFYQLNEIMSEANKTGFYYKPRIDLELLQRLDSNNFIATSACVAGVLRSTETEEIFLQPLIKHFGNNFYLEVQNHNHPTQIAHNQRMIELRNKYGLKLIHANDSHYIYPEQAKDRIKFLNGKSMKYGDEDSFVLDYPDYDTVIERYKEQDVLSEDDIITAVDNTLIFNECEELQFNKEIKMPIIFKNEDNDKLLAKVLMEKWKKEKPNVDQSRIKEYEEAIKYEYKIIKDTKMSPYFLLNERTVDLAVNKYGGVLTRTGRGSCCSFIVNKLLGFTEIDRLDADILLYPTRFMSVARIIEAKSTPDIDFNFASVEPAIKASKELLGEDGVYYMYALGTMKEQSAFRNLCRANGMQMDEYNEVAKNLDAYRQDKKWKDIIEETQKYIGIIESISPSPCSFLLLDKPISKEIGLIKVGQEICACIDGYTADVWKYLKNDFLTVRVWKIISDTYKLLGKPIPNIRELKERLDDSVWQLYEKGLTATLNQADTDISTSMLKRYKPRSVAETSSFVASIRPGFASLVNTFLNREEYSTGVDEVDNILKSTAHFMVFQENIMAFLVFCGLKEDHTYDIIKKIAKKKFKENELEELKDELLNGFIKATGSKEGFDGVWQVVEDAASYSFNAAHALSVALDSLYGAELKAHYPLEYYTTVLNEYQDDNEKTGRIIAELPHFGITLENIKFGKSKSTYSFDQETRTIYKSVSSIKYCNTQIADELFELSQSKKYKSFIDLLQDIKTETSVNTRQLKILITLNYFSDFGKNKKLLQIMDLYENLANRKQIKFSDIEKLNIDEDILKKYSGKTTAALYKELDIVGYIREVSEMIEDKGLSIKEQILFELEHLEYIDYVNPDAPKNLYFVSEFKVYKDKCKPYLQLYNLRDGTTLKTKITSNQKFSENPFTQGNLLNVKEFVERQKMKNVCGSWVKTNEYEKVVSEWEVY